jgi:hypothetical protein
LAADDSLEEGIKDGNNINEGLQKVCLLVEHNICHENKVLPRENKALKSHLNKKVWSCILG